MTMLPIYVYGSGDLFREYFNAVVTTFGTSGYQSLIRITISVSIAMVGISIVYKRDLMSIFRWFGLYYLTMYVLFIPKVSVEIIDQVNQGHVYTVDNVPWGLGVLASYSSTIGAELTQIVEQNFSMPDDLHYGSSGMLMASQMVMQASQFQITDPTFDKNMQGFVNECVFYDLLLNKYTLDDLTTAPDIWAFVSDKASPARAFVYNNQVTTCRDGASSLSQDWNTVINDGLSSYGARIFAASGSNAKTQLMKYLPLSYNYLTGISSSASQIMQQNLMANAIENGVVGMGASVNAPAALQSYAVARANDQKRLTNQTLGDMAAYWLPLMKNAFEAVLYGCFVFVLLLVMLPNGVMFLRNYLYSLLWLQMWAPMYAIINLMCSYYAKTESLAVTGNSTSMTLKTMTGLLQVNQDLAGIAGYMAVTCPILITGLLFGMHKSFAQIASYVGGSLQSLGGAAAAEAATGNISLGNSNLNNASAFNTSANHFETSARINSGSFSYQMAGGATMTVTPNGTQVLDSKGSISSLGTSVNIADSVRATASQQAEAAYSNALSKASSYADSMSAGLRSMSDLSHHMGNSQSSGDASVYSTSAGATDAVNNVHQLTDRFAKEHNISYDQANRFLQAGYISGQLSGKISSDQSFEGKLLEKITGSSVGASGEIGIRAETNHQSGTEMRHLFNEAKSFAQDSGYSHNVDTAVRAMQEHSFRAGSESGQRLMDSMGSSLDQASSARQEMSSSLQQSESYRRTATLAEENSVSMNSNASQPFAEWMANQPGTNGSGHMGMSHAADIMAHQPELAQSYANRFSQEYASQVASGWNQGLPSSAGSVASGANNASVPSSSQVQSDYASFNQEVRDKGASERLNKSIDTSAVQQTRQFMKTTQSQVSDGSAHIASQASPIQSEATEQTKNS